MHARREFPHASLFPRRRLACPVVTLTDLTTGNVRTFTTDQAQQNFTFGEQGPSLAITTEPDGTRMVGGKPAQSTLQAGKRQPPGQAQTLFCILGLPCEDPTKWVLARTRAVPRLHVPRRHLHGPAGMK